MNLLDLARSLAANLILLGLMLIALGLNSPILLGGMDSAVPSFKTFPVRGAADGPG